MKRKEMDTSHSRPFKATAPGTPPNVGVKRNLAKKPAYGEYLQIRAMQRKARKAANAGA